jgi:NADH:ubiquinone oxidoreductase subunit 4 (subunit M)
MYGESESWSFCGAGYAVVFLAWELEHRCTLMLSIWGGRHLYAATKFILYTAGGSLFIWLERLKYMPYKYRDF